MISEDITEHINRNIIVEDENIPVVGNNNGENSASEDENGISSDVTGKDTPETGAYLVCKGAFCKCNLGSSPFVRLQITTHGKYYLNDMQGNEKLVATVKDNTFPAPLFGSCSSNNGKPCNYTPEKIWEINAGDEHPQAGGNKILTTNGKITCPAKPGGGTITIVMHGQSQNVSEDDVEDYSADMSDAINCFADSDEITEKKKNIKYCNPSVDYISLEDTKSNAKSKKTQYVRCSVVQHFKAAISTSKADRNAGQTADPDLVSWSLWPWSEKCNDLLSKKTVPALVNDLGINNYIAFGDEFVMIFKKEGKFVIEGFGKKSNERKTVFSNCTLILQAIEENKITVLRTTESIGYRGVPIKIEVETIIPPTTEELSALTIRISDSEYGELDVKKGVMSVTYTPENEGEYIIEAFYEGKEYKKEKTKIEVRSNDIAKITPHIAKARKDSTIRYTVELINKNDSNLDNIIWNIIQPNKGVLEATGKSYTLKLSHLGKYTIKAAYKNTLLPLSWSKEKGQRTIESIINKISTLECALQKNDKGSYITYVKKQFSVKARMILDYVPPATGEISDSRLFWTIKPIGETPALGLIKIADANEPLKFLTLGMLFISKGSSINLQIEQPGEYELTVAHGTQAPQKILLTIKHSKIEKWTFTNGKDIYRKYTGWKKDLNIYIKVSGWEGQSVKVNLWLDLRNKKKEGDRLKLLDIKELKEKIKVGEDGTIRKVVGSESDLWTLLEKQEYETEAALFFTVTQVDTVCENHNNAIHSSDFRKGHYYPVATSETYTYVPDKINVSGFFADGDGSVLKRIVTYGESPNVIIDIAEGRKQKLNDYVFAYSLYENEKGGDNTTIEKKEIDLNKQGRSTRILHTGVSAYGKDTHEKEIGSPSKPRLFYFEVYMKEKDAGKYKKMYSYPPSYGTGRGNDKYMDLDLGVHTSKEEVDKILNGSLVTSSFTILGSQKKDTQQSPQIDTEKIADNWNEGIDTSNEEKIKALPDKKNYFLQLKIAKDAALNKSLEKLAPVIIGEGLSVEKHEKGNCKRCTDPVTLAQMKEIFPDCKDENILKTSMEAFNDFMENFGMATCWNKAHFFAQTRIEAGTSLNIKNESFNYSTIRLISGEYINGKNWVKGNLMTKEGGYFTDGTFKKSLFSYYASHKNLANEHGRKDLDKRLDAKIQKADEEAIANTVYDDKNRGQKHKLGNNQVGDGWRFKGRGFIQLTGRSNYENSNKYTVQHANTEILSDTGAKEVGKPRVAMIACMAYWIEKSRDLQNRSNGNNNVDEISRLIGSDVDWEGKKKAFKEITSKLFKVDDCLYGTSDVPFDAIDIITYHIYHDRKIEKHIPKNNKYPNSRKYIYHDAKKVKYTVGTFECTEVFETSTNSKNDLLTKVPDDFDANKTWLHDSSSNINAKKSYYYYDTEGKLESIVVENKSGKSGGIRKYHVNKNKKVILVKLKNISVKNSESEIIAGYTFVGTERFYCGEDQCASFIGMLFEFGIPWKGSGNTHKDGTGYPSVTHVNGFSFDFHYSRDAGADKNHDQTLIDIMNNWNYKPIYIGKKYPVTAYNNATRMGGHDDHIHCGPNKTVSLTEIKEK